ncbi:prospero homeobox protein 1-like [Notolabrus celidotus]|uniref:prospero homeobox protein 1-like n=1 Tax=Notolabrus celidotus TaxID=1203425 RepID=UPI00148FA55A|nr:prospero homeobox protein 1-like [Notolabrus celidotus]
MYYSCNICPDICHAEHPSGFQPDLLSGVPATLHKDGEKIKMLNKQAYYSDSDACSRLICSSLQELNPSEDNGHTSTKGHKSLSSSSCGHPEWNYNSGHQAKRARVESIIKGMTGSPGMQCTDVMKNQYEESDSVEDNEGIQEVHFHQGTSASGNMSHCQMTRKQLQSQLREGFDNVDAQSDSSNSSKEEKYHTWKDCLENSPSDKCTDLFSEFESSSSRKLQGWKKVKLMNYFQSKPERIKLMADVLKYELSRAVSRSVDSIFKSKPLPQPLSVSEGNTETDLPLQSTVCKESKPRLSCGGTAEVPSSDVQTEALSLVVQKPQHDRNDKFILQSRSRAHLSPKPQVLLCQESTLCEDAACQHALNCLQEVDPVKCATFNAHWNSTKVRSKVNSRSARLYAHAESVDPLLLESLCLPRVKIESDSLLKNNLYMLNEGLTTSHLKKAKLMFFYTRYPSSMVLKMCFHDVQFTRCITSQLIKWFSNFREFFYIQMEKFARHALIEGSTDIRSLTVGRESELFRALNMHYNKANDFQVPDRFLEVAEITLREFFIAISLGKDHDPSWKKAIYKVICKLDSDVPAEFKHHFSV